MEDLWLKIKFWTKLGTVGLVTLYIAVFIAKNSDKKATFWYWYSKEYAVPILVLSASAFVGGIVAAILIRTTFKTVRQLRKMSRDARTQRIERELADMKSKAAMLQTKPNTDSAATERSDAET